MSKSSVTGSVKFFNAAKGFGFIAPEDGGKDVFVPAASISASGLARLKAGQRVSFDLEPDAKGPKAVKLILLEDAPADVKPAAHQAGAKQPPAKKPVNVYSDSASANGAVEEVMDALTAAGESPRLIEVAATSRDELKQLSLLLREADQSLVRRYDPLFLALQLDDRFISESDFWTGIAEHPSLVNGPVVAHLGKARICKTASDVKAFLGAGTGGGTGKPKGITDRMAALMRGEALPPRPVAVAPETEKPMPAKAPVKLPAKAAAKPAPEPKQAEAKKPEPQKKAPAKAAKPEAKPGKKAAAKAVKKAKAAPAKAKKKK